MLRVLDIRKTYEGKPLLRGLSFEVADGERLCLLGPSGGGKSTLLRIIAGVERADAGQIFWDDLEITDVPAHKRRFGLMFQDYALFPHRTVAGNIAFGLEMAGQSDRDIRREVRRALQNIHMLDFADRPVAELSGGEQQRVAWARALITDPRLLMLDEPMGALDHDLRTALIHDLRAHLMDTGKPVIYVTHDRQEAFGLADRVILLHDGVIVQNDTPETLYASPADAWVARFLGLGNLIQGRVDDGRVTTTLGTFDLKPSRPTDIRQGDPCAVLLRPDDARVEPLASEKDVPGDLPGNKTAPEKTSGAAPSLTCDGEVHDLTFMGEYYEVDVRVRDTALTVHTKQPFRRGDAVRLSWRKEDILCLPER